jgi:dTDP-4-amino-4,6-dideoxygalactose transaminase
VGCNSRLDTIQAAVLGIKLKNLDDYIKARVRVADYYDRAFHNHPKITTPFRAPYTNHVFHQYTLQLNGVDRDGLHKWLADQQVPSMIYYPVPAHRQKMFEAFGGKNFELKVTDWLTERVISLPMHTEMDEEQLRYVTEKVLEYVNRLRFFSHCQEEKNR